MNVGTLEYAYFCTWKVCVPLNLPLRRSLRRCPLAVCIVLGRVYSCQLTFSFLSLFLCRPPCSFDFIVSCVAFRIDPICVSLLEDLSGLARAFHQSGFRKEARRSASTVVYRESSCFHHAASTRCGATVWYGNRSLASETERA